MNEALPDQISYVTHTFQHTDKGSTSSYVQNTASLEISRSVKGESLAIDERSNLGSESRLSMGRFENESAMDT